MEKKIILEELMRIQELMGVSVNLNRLLTEAAYPRYKGTSFDFGINPAIKAQLVAQMIDWSNNVVGLTKSGARVTFDDLVEYGKKLSRDAGDDAGTNEAKALYYMAMSQGRGNFMDLMQRITSINQQTAKVAFESNVATITNQTVKNSLNNMIAGIGITSQNISTFTKRDIEALMDDLTALRRTIESENIDPATKRSLINIVDDQINILETATLSEYSSRTRVGTTEIDAGPPNIPPVGPPTRNWALIEADVLAATGKKIDFDANPDAKVFKDLYESGQMTETQAKTNIINYIMRLRDIAADTSLSEAERRSAQGKLDNIITTMGKVGGAGGEFIVGLAKFGMTFLTTFNKKGVIKGILTLAAIITGVWLWDDGLYLIEGFAESSHAKCLRKITGYNKAILDSEWLYGGTMQDFIESEYPESKYCETIGKTLPPDQKIKLFTFTEQDDIYYIQVVYEDDCRDTIRMADDNGAEPEFVSKRKCGEEEIIVEKKYKCVSGTCKEDATGTYTESTCGGDCSSPSPNSPTLGEFETYVKNELGEENVSVVDGPDSDGIFSVTALGDTYKYKWENNGWVYKN